MAKGSLRGAKPLSFKGEGDKGGEVEEDRNMEEVKMSPELFSRRHNLRGASDELIYDEIPVNALTGFSYIFHDYINYIDDIKLIKDYCGTTRMPRDTCDLVIAKDKKHRVEILEIGLETPGWSKFLGIYELISLSFYKKPPTKRGEFSQRLNSLFREENIGYEMQDGKIERINNEFMDRYIKDARILLKAPHFKGADQHFEKAIKALNIRPKPDVENCVKDAVSAIESVGRIIADDDKALLSDIIKDMTKKGAIPKPLDQVFQKVYAYRGNEPGVAHGAVDISKVTEDEAELILAMSAAMIIYLVKKRSKLWPPNHLKS